MRGRATDSAGLFTKGLGRGNSPLSVRELRPHFPDSPGGPDGSGSPGPFNALMPALAPAAVMASANHSSIGSTVTSLVDSIGTFFSQLAGLSWGPLLIGLTLYAV